MHHSAIKSVDSARTSDNLCSKIVICIKKNTHKKTIHRVMMKNCIVKSWKIQFGEFSAEYAKLFVIMKAYLAFS